MANQSQGASFGKANAEPVDPVAGRGPLGKSRRNGRRRNHHVVAKLRAAHATAAAAFKGAIGHHRGGQGALQILGQPALIQAGIDVVPGQALVAKGLQVSSIHRLNRAPGA